MSGIIDSKEKDNKNSEDVKVYNIIPDDVRGRFGIIELDDEDIFEDTNN